MIGSGESSFAIQMENAEFKINKANLLVEVCKEIDAMHISQYNHDVQGDLYEYLLGHLNIAGRNGQFRTPRHIIRMMVQMIDPKVNERICDPAAGTCGFLVNTYQYILEKNTSKDILTYDEEGMPHNLAGDLLDERSEEFLQTEALTGFDSDSGMTMLRIGSMNLMLHGIKHPNFFITTRFPKLTRKNADMMSCWRIRRLRGRWMLLQSAKICPPASRRPSFFFSIFSCVSWKWADAAA